MVQHVEEVVVEGGKGHAPCECQVDPVSDALDGSVGVACVHGWVVQYTPSCHDTLERKEIAARRRITSQK